MPEKVKAKRNRTLVVESDERERLAQKLIHLPDEASVQLENIMDKTLVGDMVEWLDKIPQGIADLIVLDPPYNLSKNFHGYSFKALTNDEYLRYLRLWFGKVVAVLKPSGSLYLCGDWRSSAALQQVMSEHLTVMNRITWQREKGRGAKFNWKNGMEDIWFGVRNPKEYYFNVNSVKLKRKVFAPYKENGKPKDWQSTETGNFRITHPSNFWDDISVPYWSMPENTAHPTQKPEKLLAKLILASCPGGGLVFDPFLGSGSSSVAAKKLGRHFIGIEMNEEYAIWAEKRLENAEHDRSIQGYVDGVFWERNTSRYQKQALKKGKRAKD